MTSAGDVPIEAMLADLVEVDGPGVTVGVYRDGALASIATRGLASLEYGVPITSRTRFDLASVSKQMTAACALLLHRDGVVDVDADLRTWLPELGLDGITLRGCLHHTTGLRDYEELNWLRGDALADMAGLPQFLPWLAAATQTNFPPGSDISYSNSGYVAVAAALSRAAKRPFAQLMRERVFAPLGMDDTLLHDAVGVVVPRMAFSYRLTEPAGYLRQEMPEEQVGDGAVLTTLEDLAGWHGFLLDGRGLGAEIQRELVAPAVLADGRSTRYGCGVAGSTMDGHPALAHAGSMYAFRSHLVCVPDQKLGVTVLSNHGGTDVSSLARDVLRHCLAGPVARRPAVVPAPPSEDRLWFCPDTNEIVVSTSPADGGLTLDTGYETVTLTWDGAGGWEAADAQLRVEPAPGGELHTLDWMGRRRCYLPAEAPEADAAEIAGVYDGAELGEVEVAQDGATVLLRLGRRSLALDQVARYDGDEVYRASGEQRVWVRRHRDDGSLSVSTGSTVFRRLPRVGQLLKSSAGSTAARPSLR